MVRLASFIKKKEEEKDDFLAMIEEHKLEHELVQKQFNRQIKPYIRRASSKEYKKWLAGYLDNGAEPTHYYNYRLPDNFYVSTDNIKSLPLCGSSAIHVIVPKGIDIDTSAGIGHCNFYLMTDFTVIGDWVPVYTDTVI